MRSKRPVHCCSRRRQTLIAASLVALAAAFIPEAAHAQTFSFPDFSAQVYAAGLSRITTTEFAPDGRMFVCEQGGALRVVKNGTLLATPFTTLAVDTAGERGLLGVAFDPDFSTNGFVYAYHTVSEGGVSHNRVSRFTANGDIALPGSATTILDLEPLGPTNHNGGAIHFGNDGKLYVAVGDNANPANAQTLNNRLGKMLRINADGSIPTDNPFYNVATGDNRAIWANGLRNPFTFAFQPGTGLMHINDVGQNAFEEINVGVAGANYGWGSGGGANEGPFSPTGSLSAFTPPLFAYGHGSGTELGFSIVGGAFYNPPVSLFPTSFTGDYFYADFVNGWIRALDAGTSNSYLFISNLGATSGVKVGPDGALYYSNYVFGSGEGAVYRVAYTGAIVSAPEAGTLSLLFTPLGALFMGALARRRCRLTS